MAGNYEYLLGITNPTNLVYRGMAFTWSDLRLAVANADVYYYSFVTSPTKHTVIYNRALEAGEGPVDLDLIFGATFTVGTESSAINLIAGEPAGEIQITKGVTNVVGGVVSPVAHLFRAGANTPVAASSGLPTILKPGTTVLARVTNSALGTNPGILFALAFAEVVISTKIYEG